MLQRLVYSKFQLYQVDPKDLDDAPIEPYPFCEPSTFRIVTVIDEPATQVVYEDWFKGQDVQWTTWTDAIHFVLQGKAEITLWQPPDLQEKIVAIAEAPCVYLIPRGARVQWRVLSDEPFRKLVADVPNPGFGEIAPTLDRSSS
jgi:hypothetical protein